MSKISVDEILQAIEQMSVMEICELAKALTKKFDLPQHSTQTATIATPKEKTEEKSEFDVFITNAGTNKIAAIKSLRKVIDIGLKEAKDSIDSITQDNPLKIATAVDKKMIDTIKANFSDSDAVLEVR